MTRRSPGHQSQNLSSSANLQAGPIMLSSGRLGALGDGLAWSVPVAHARCVPRSVRQSRALGTP